MRLETASKADMLANANKRIDLTKIPQQIVEMGDLMKTAARLVPPGTADVDGWLGSTAGHKCIASDAFQNWVKSPLVRDVVRHPDFEKSLDQMNPQMRVVAVAGRRTIIGGR